MQVWIARDADAAQVAPLPTIVSSARVSVSHVWENDTPTALNDQVEPASSQDSTIARFTWWPRTGTREWVQYDFETEVTLCKASVYWFDDTPDGGCRVPAQWSLESLQNGEWVPVPDPTGYTTLVDQYNEVSFTPVSTKALRIKVRLQRDYSAGILEWNLVEAK